VGFLKEGQKKMSGLDDKALLRVYNKLLRRVPRDAFGANYITLAVTRPALFNTLMRVRREIRERFDFRDVNGVYRFGPTKQKDILP
jgi:hypothetical protein